MPCPYNDAPPLYYPLLGKYNDALPFIIGKYNDALPLLSQLVETDSYNQAGVWLKHAECLHNSNELESSVTSYVKVLTLAPHHTETRMTLASLYSQLGMTEDALALLDAGVAMVWVRD